MRKHTHASASQTHRNNNSKWLMNFSQVATDTIVLRLQVRRECSRWKIVYEFRYVKSSDFSVLVSFPPATLFCCAAIQVQKTPFVDQSVASEAENQPKNVFVGNARETKSPSKIQEWTEKTHTQNKQNTRYEVIFCCRRCRHQVTSSVQCQWLVRHISGWLAAMFTFRSHMCILIYSIIHKNIWVEQSDDAARAYQSEKNEYEIAKIGQREAQTLSGTMNAEKRQQRTRDVNYQEQ